MADQKPPEGSPSEEQGESPQEAQGESDAPQGAGGGDQLTQLIGNLNKGLAMLSEVLKDSGDQKLGALGQQLVSDFQNVVDMMSGGKGGDMGAQAGQEVADKGSGDQMSGANENAKPMSPSGY